jgi:uncharacterized protein (TIRG00374 family)
LCLSSGARAESSKRHYRFVTWRIMNFRFWLGLFISALFLYIAFHDVDLALLLHSIKSTSIPLTILVVALTICFYLIRALRWFYLLKPIKRIGLPSLFTSTVIGFAANFVLPFRLGELIRANQIGRMESISRSSSFATIVIERLFDSFTILLILLFVILYIDFPGEWESMGRALRTAGFGLVSVLILLILLLIVLKEKSEAFIEIVNRLLFFLPSGAKQRALHSIRDFSSGLVVVKNPSQLVAIMFYSLCLWCLTVFQIYIFGISMGVSLPFLAPFLILTLLCFSVTLPSAPGYLGTFHLACQYGLIFYGLSKEKALSMAIVLHAAGFVPTVILGFILFLVHHITLRSLTNV